MVRRRSIPGSQGGQEPNSRLAPGSRTQFKNKISLLATRRSTKRTGSKNAIHIGGQGPQYVLKDISAELAEFPGKLELHTTKAAPSTHEIHRQIAAVNERERLRHFGVPIKMLSSQVDTDLDLLSDVERADLDLYGSRVVIDDRNGRVVGLEVADDLDHTLFMKHEKSADFCQCGDPTYPVSDRLRESRRARRVFMAKVLLLEAALRLPALPVLHAQADIPPLHDFLYQQTVLSMTIIVLILGTRLATVSFSELGRFEPCRSIMTMMTSIGFAFMCCFVTAQIEKYTIFFVEYNQFAYSISLQTLQAKRKIQDGAWPSYPYIVAIFICHQTSYSVVISFILLVQKKLIPELSGWYMLVVGLMFVPHYFVTLTVVGKVVPDKAWSQLDPMMVMVGTFFSAKYFMFRFYSLQQVVLGKVMKLDESMFNLVAIMFIF